MQQPCKTCGYEFPETDKFCRQCGSQFAVESEFSAAVTLNHGRAAPNPPVASVGTGRLPPSVGDAIAGDTERYYSQQQYAPAHIEQPPSFAPLKSASSFWSKSSSGFTKWAFGFFFVIALLVATGMVVFFAQEAHYAKRQLADRASASAGAEYANGRAQGAWEQMEEALRLIHEAEKRAAGAGAQIIAGDEKPIDLDKYAYPEAQVEAKVNSYGKEALSLLTRQNFDDVQKFYEERFGKPVLQVAVNDRRNQRKKLLFQSSTIPSILVKVEEIGSRNIESPQVKITILRSFLRFPRLNEVQE